jgi:hypothetical protein
VSVTNLASAPPGPQDRNIRVRSRVPVDMYATKGFTGQGRRMRLPDEFTRYVRKGSKVRVVART